MSMRLYNTLTRKVEDFAPMDGKTVRMYVCGPTVYDDPHIGHARSAYIFDVLHRYLAYKGFTVNFVRNVTDVDDKIIEKARHETQDTRLKTHDVTEKCQEVAQRYLKSYHETMDRLGIGRPTHEPLATGHIDEMTNLISQLVLNGSAYETKTGDVYFAVRKFPGYGKLSNRSIDELQAGTRLEPGEQKQDPLDFALWKAAKPGEPWWSSPWGKGRPGWHIECSAMSTKHLGDEFDIHGGGLDLVFPHHENEIAQAQAIGKKFARFWIHNGLLTVNGEKMSKSLGNFITVEKALIDSENHPDVLKVFFLNSHYRSPVDYGAQQIEAAYQRWFQWNWLLKDAMLQDEIFKKSWASHSFTLPSERAANIKAIAGEFIQAMDNDLNTPEALGCLDRLVNLADSWRSEETLRQKQSPSETTVFKPSNAQAIHCLSIIEVAEELRRLGKVLGLFERDNDITLEQRTKIQHRENARRKHDFKTADQIRRELQQENIELMDTPDGTLWQRLRG